MSKHKCGSTFWLVERENGEFVCTSPFDGSWSYYSTLSDAVASIRDYMEGDEFRYVYRT